MRGGAALLRSTFGHVCKGNSAAIGSQLQAFDAARKFCIDFSAFITLLRYFFDFNCWRSGIQPSVSFVSSLEPDGERSTGNGGGRGGAALRISRPGLGDKGLSALCSSGHPPHPPAISLYFIVWYMLL